MNLPNLNLDEMPRLTTEQSRKLNDLKVHAVYAGRRDPRLNRAFKGSYMIVQEYEDSETPTDSSANGPWCIVGDDLGELIDTAYANFVG